MCFIDNDFENDNEMYPVKIIYCTVLKVAVALQELSSERPLLRNSFVGGSEQSSHADAARPVQSWGQNIRQDQAAAATASEKT